MTNGSPSPTKSANDSLFPPLSPRKPTNHSPLKRESISNSPSKRESTNSSPYKTSSVHKSSTEPVLRHIPSDDTITQRVQSEPSLRTCPNDDNTIVNECNIDDLSDNKSDSNAIDDVHQDFRTLKNDIIDGNIKDIKLTSTVLDNDSFTDNKTESLKIDHDIIKEGDGDVEKKDATKEDSTTDTADCDNNDDENNDEEEKKGGKRVRKRRKHQKKPHVPRFIGIEECLAD